MNVQPGATFEAVAKFPSGLVGELGVQITDNEGATTVARVTAGIIEYPAGSGIYAITLTAPLIGGQYSLAWDDGSGNWAVEDLVVGSGGDIAVGTDSLYMTVDELKAMLKITSSSQDDDIAAALSAACRAIDNRCNRRFWADSTDDVRYYSPRRIDFLQIDDLSTLTSLEVDFNADGVFEETWVIDTEFLLEPLNTQIPWRPKTAIRRHPLGGRFFPLPWPRTVKVTGTFGWSVTPPEVVNATRIIATQMFKRPADAPFGALNLGTEVAARIVYSDPQVRDLLDPLTKLTV